MINFFELAEEYVPVLRMDCVSIGGIDIRRSTNKLTKRTNDFVTFPEHVVIITTKYISDCLREI